MSPEIFRNAKELMKKTSTKPNYESWPRQKIKITDLFLDPSNIRLQIEVKSQEAIIHDLFLNEDAMQVLETIVRHGLFPDEVPVIVKENNKFVVMEGNRRVAALKVLARPEIVPTKEATIRQLLKSAGDIVKELEVVVAPDRDSVQPLLAIKHTQNTRRPWKTLRQAYFYKAEIESGKTVQDLRNDYPNVDIGKFLRLINIHKIAKAIQYDSDQIAKKVHSERRFPASTLERLYEDKYVRDFLGFEFDKDGDVKIKIKKTEFEKGFKKIIQDIVDKIVDSRHLNSERNRKEYLAGFPVSAIPNKTKGGNITTTKDFKEKPINKAEKKTKLAPKDIQFTLQSAGVRRMLNELQRINYKKFPNASHDLLRSFLECALKAYFDYNNKKIQPKRTGGNVFLSDVLNEFKDEMDKIGNKKLAQVAGRIKDATKMSSYTAQFLNAANHNPDVFATPQDAKDAWDAMEPLFRYILTPPKET